MKLASLDVFGIPEAQARPRVFLRGGRPMAHSPKSTWFSIVHGAAVATRPPNPIDVPVHVVTHFRFPPLKSGKKNLVWKDKKPDADNLLKAVFDALTQAGWWTDDGLVVSWTGSKKFVSKEDAPGMFLEIHEAFDPLART